MSLKTLSAVALTAVAALALSGCSGGTAAPAPGESFDPDSSAEITFAWWGNDDRAARFEQAIAAFNEEYPNITVVRNFNAWGDYWTARNTEAAGHSLPDAVMIDAGYLGEYASKNLLADLNPYRGGVLPLDGVSNAVLGAGTVKDKLLSVPLGTNAYSLMYNKDILDELGVPYPTDTMTWEEMDDFILQVNKAGGATDPRIYGSEDYTGGFVGFIYAMMQRDNAVFDADGKAAFTEQDVVDYLETGKKLRDAGDFYPVERSVALAPKGGFLAGESAVWFNWSTTVLQGMTDAGTENIGMVQPPLDAGEKAHVLAPHPSMMLSVAANSKQPQAAAALVNFLATSPKVAEIFGTSLGTPPTEAGQAAIDRQPADTVNLDYIASIQDELTASYPILPAGYGTIEAKWGELHEQMRYGEIDEKQFAQSLFSEMSMVLG